MKSHDESSPSKNRESSLHSLSSMNQDAQKPVSGAIDHFVNDLYLKFLNISSQVNIQHDISAFNMAEYDRSQKKIKYDKQLVLAKLKQLENKAELNRANMELEQRKKKLFKVKKHEEDVLPQKNNYLNTYRKLKQDATQQIFQDQYKTDSEDQNHNGNEGKQSRGVNYYHQLKRHPKILKYTIDRVKSKEVTELQEKTSRTTKLQNYKNEIKAIIHTTADLTSRSRKNKSIDTINPEKVVDNIFRKIYTKKNRQLSTLQVRKDLRLSHFLQKQDEILTNIDQKSLSKDNSKRLKERLNDIVNQMYQDDRKHKNKLLFPKIPLHNTISVTSKKQ